MIPERLPLFPLNVVLVPTAVMPLHIFEERYQEMVSDVLRGSGRFGLIYHDPDEHGPFQGDPGQVGCIAEVREHQDLVEGRSMIMTVGLERFVIREYLDSPKRYYEAMVEPYPDWEIDPSLARKRRGQTLDLFTEVLERNDGGEGTAPEIDLERDVSFPIAATIAVDRAWKQELLELRREVDRLDRLDVLLRRALEAP